MEDTKSSIFQPSIADKWRRVAWSSSLDPPLSRSLTTKLSLKKLLYAFISTEVLKRHGHYSSCSFCFCNDDYNVLAAELQLVNSTAPCMASQCYMYLALHHLHSSYLKLWFEFNSLNDFLTPWHFRATYANINFLRVI